MRRFFPFKPRVFGKLTQALTGACFIVFLPAFGDSSHDASQEPTKKRLQRNAPYCQKRTDKKTLIETLFTRRSDLRPQLNHLFPSSAEQDSPFSNPTTVTERGSLPPFNPQMTLSFLEQVIRCESPSLYKLSVLEILQELSKQESNSLDPQNQQIVADLTQALSVLNALPADFNLALANQIQEFLEKGAIASEPMSSLLSSIDKIRNGNKSPVELEVLRALLFGKMFGGFIGAIDFFVGPDVAEALRQRFLLGPPASPQREAVSFMPNEANFFLKKLPPGQKDNPAVQEWINSLTKLLTHREHEPQKAVNAFSSLRSATEKLGSLSPTEHAHFRKWLMDRLGDTQSGKISQGSKSEPHLRVLSTLQSSLINTLRQLDSASSETIGSEAFAGYPALLMEEAKLRDSLSVSSKKDLEELEYFFKTNHSAALNSISRIALMSLSEKDRHFLAELIRHPSAAHDSELISLVSDPDPAWIARAQELLTQVESPAMSIANLAEQFSEEVLKHPLPITSKVKLLTLDPEANERLLRLMGNLNKNDPHNQALLERLLTRGSAEEIFAASQLYDSAFHQYAEHFKQDRRRDRFISDLIENGKLSPENEQRLEQIAKTMAGEESVHSVQEIKQQLLERLSQEARFIEEYGKKLTDFAQGLRTELPSTSSQTMNDWRLSIGKKSSSALSDSEKKALGIFKENDELGESFRRTQQRVSEELHNWSEALEKSSTEEDRAAATKKIQELQTLANQEQARVFARIQENEFILTSLKQNRDLPVVDRAFDFMKDNGIPSEMGDIVFSRLTQLLGSEQRRDKLFDASPRDPKASFAPAHQAAQNLMNQEERLVQALFPKQTGGVPKGWHEARKVAQDQQKKRESRRQLIMTQLAPFGVKSQGDSGALDFSHVNLVNKNLDLFKKLLAEYRTNLGTNELDAPDFWEVFQGQLETLYSKSNHSDTFAFNEGMAVRVKRIPIPDPKDDWNQGGLDRIEFEFVDGTQLSAELKEKALELKANLDRRLGLIKSTTSTINKLQVAYEDVPRAFIQAWTGLDISKYAQPTGLLTHVHGIEWGDHGPTTLSDRQLTKDLKQERELIEQLRRMGNLPVEYSVPGEKKVKIPAYVYADLMENRASLMHRYHGQESRALLRDLDYTIAGMEIAQEAGIAAGVTLATMGAGSALSGTALALKVGRAASLLNSAVRGSRVAVQAVSLAERLSPLALKTLQYGRGLGSMSLRGVTGYASGIGLSSLKDSAVRTWEMRRALQTDWKEALEKGTPIKFPHHLDENENGIPDGAEGMWATPTEFMPRLSEFVDGSSETALTFGMVSPLSSGFERVLPSGPRILGIPISKLIAPVLGLGSATVIKDQVISNHLLLRDRNGDGKIDTSDQIGWSDTGWQALTNLGYSAPLDELGIAFLAQSRLPLLRNFRNFSPTTQASIGRLIGWELNQELSGGVAVGQYYLGRDAQKDSDGDGKPDGGFVSMTGQRAGSASEAYFTGRFESLYQDYLAGSGAFHRAHGIGMAAAAIRDPGFGQEYLQRLNSSDRYFALRQEFLASIPLSDLRMDNSSIGLGHQELIRNAASHQGVDTDQFVHFILEKKRQSKFGNKSLQELIFEFKGLNP